MKAASLGDIGQLQQQVAGNARISASLQQSRYGSDRVFAVQPRGGKLIVYVY